MECGGGGAGREKKRFKKSRRERSPPLTAEVFSSASEKVPLIEHAPARRHPSSARR